ncbi:hypothetical protein [Hydrogenophaga aquatica]
MHTSNVLYLGMHANPTAIHRAAENQGKAWHNPGMTTGRPMNACHRCGATAYRPILDRDALGAMRPTGRYQCVRCKFSFTNVREWRDGATHG